MTEKIEDVRNALITAFGTKEFLHIKEEHPDFLAFAIKLSKDNKKLRECLDETSKELNEVLDKCYKDKEDHYYTVADKQYKVARKLLSTS